MAWTEPQFSRDKVNAAAKMVASTSALEMTKWKTQEWQQYEASLNIVNNWRGSHSYPLNTFQMSLRRTANRFDRRPLIAQRIKRLVSIIHKLERFPKMNLTQMQDLGGCRAIFSSASRVRKAVDYYENMSSIKHELASKDDYILNPKASGYRGIHLVYRYVSDKPAKTVYNGLKIEMQLRSNYQHAWATAVETVGMFSGQALKSSMGSEEWQRFFSLMGSVIAIRERCPIVPGTPTSRTQLVRELSQLARKLNVEARLKEYGRALRHLERASLSLNAFYFLLQLDPGKGELSITGFAANDVVGAQQRYSQAEELVRSNPGSDAVLVSVDSVNALQKAYPNYFADTRVFVALMNQARSGHVKSISVPALQLEQG